MKKLQDIVAYCIKVDYYMWSEEKGDYTEPLYLSLVNYERNGAKYENVIVFRENITPDLRVFSTFDDAEYYISQRCVNSCCYENARTVKIKYDFDMNEWKEV